MLMSLAKIRLFKAWFTPACNTAVITKLTSLYYLHKSQLEFYLLFKKNILMHHCLSILMCLHSVVITKGKKNWEITLSSFHNNNMDIPWNTLSILAIIKIYITSLTFNIDVFALCGVTITTTINYSQSHCFLVYIID